MKKLGFLGIGLSIFAFGSTPSGAPAKPGTYTPVPLVVTVNACSPLNASEICGDGFETDTDGNSVYRDGEDGVKAQIDQYGNVIIDFQTTRAKIRGLVYKYGSASPAPSGGGSNHYLSTIGGALQAMNFVDPTNVSSCPLYDDDNGQPQYRHGFNRDCQSGFGPVGAPLVVVRSSATAWEIEPDPQAGALARVFSITTKGPVQKTDFGFIGLPFRMSLRAK